MSRIKILLGPLGKYGGVKQHIENIQHFSTYSPDVFHLTPLSIKCLLNDIASRTNTLQEREHLSKQEVSETCSKQELLFKNLIDPLGIFLSKVVFPSKYSIVHLHGHPYWPEVYNLSLSSSTKYIYSVHQVYQKEDFKSEKRWQIRNFLNKLMFSICKKVDVVISVAKWQQTLLQEEGIDSIYIPNGVNVEKCEQGIAERFRKKYGIEEDFFLFGGDLRWYKRPGLFIELAKRLPGKLFVMKGKDVTKENLLRMGFDVPKNLICLGLLPYEDLFDLYAASKVFILTSKNDTFPTALLPICLF